MSEPHQGFMIVFSIFASSQTIVAKVYSTSGWAQEDTFIKLIVQQY